MMLKGEWGVNIEMIIAVYIYMFIYMYMGVPEGLL